MLWRALEKLTQLLRKNLRALILKYNRKDLIIVVTIYYIQEVKLMKLDFCWRSEQSSEKVNKISHVVLVEESRTWESRVRGIRFIRGTAGNQDYCLLHELMSKYSLLLAVLFSVGVLAADQSSYSLVVVSRVNRWWLNIYAAWCGPMQDTHYIRN